MKYFIILPLIILYHFIQCQPFYIRSDFGIGIVDFNNCNINYNKKSFVNTLQVGVAIYPDNKILYGADFIVHEWDTTVLPPFYSKIRCFLPRHPNWMNGDSYFYNGIKSNFKGDIYGAGYVLSVWHPNNTDSLLGYFDFVNRYNFYCEGICFMEDRLFGLFYTPTEYLFEEIDMSDPTKLRYICTIPFYELGFNFNRKMGSLDLTSVPYDCDSTSIYLSATDSRSNSWIYLIDTSSCNVIKLCENRVHQFEGLATKEEFYVPTCYFHLDLDEDDSSVLGKGYKDTLLCPEVLLPIQDIDLQISSKKKIDSIIIEFDRSTVFDQFDLLQLSTTDPKVNINIILSQKIVLSNIGNADSSIFSKLVKSIRYKNLNPNPKVGSKNISVQLYAGIRADTAIATIIIIPNLQAGIDTNITICPNEKDLDLFELLQSPKTAGGFWVYNNAPHTGILNPKIDQSGKFYYILDRKDCSSDTATLTLTILPELNPSLGNDRSICPNKSIVLKPKDRGSRILWSDNSSQDSLVVTSPGQYFVKLIDMLGCEYSDTIVIIKSDYNIESIDTNYCFGNIFDWLNQKIQADGVYQDTSKFSLNCDTIFTLKIKFLTENKLLKTQSICQQDSFLFKNKFYKSGDIINDTIASINSCDTIVEIKINEFVVSKINFNTDTIICRGEVVNLGATTTFQSYKWSTGEDKSNIQVRSGTYTLTVIDVNGCKVNSSITIKESPPIQYGAIPMDPLCPEDKGSIEITNLQGGSAPLEYYLNGKKVSLSALDYLNSGFYIFKAIDSENCEVSDTIQILDAAIFDVVFDDQIELEEGTSHSLTFPIQNPKIASIQVSPNSDVVIQNGSELKFSPKEDITYTITFTDERGCELIKTITFTIKRNEGFYAPTAFSPNGDNINDVWQPIYGNVYTLVSAKIFDRWGEQVYYTNNPSVEWNGTYKSQQCNPGVYVYLIELRHRDGSVKKFSGDVGLIR